MPKDSISLSFPPHQTKLTHSVTYINAPKEYIPVCHEFIIVKHKSVVFLLFSGCLIKRSLMKTSIFPTCISLDIYYTRGTIHSWHDTESLSFLTTGKDVASWPRSEGRRHRLSTPLSTAMTTLRLSPFRLRCIQVYSFQLQFCEGPVSPTIAAITEYLRGSKPCGVAAVIGQD